MTKQSLYVALGADRYRVDRPFGAMPPEATGRVTDVACCSRGHVFVLLRYDPYVDPAGPAVVELAPDGRCLAAWGQDLILDAHMLAIDAEDRIHIVDRDCHEIVICDRSGRRIGGIGNRHQPGEPFNHPTDIAFTPQGEIVVSDGYAGNSVHRFDASGRHLASWGEPGEVPGAFRNPHALWVLSDGRIVVADRDNDRLQIFDAGGALLSVWRDHVRPMAVWSDSAGAIYVTDQTPRLTRLSPDGMLTGRCRPVLNGAHGGAMDAAGTIYLAEGNPSRVTRLFPVG